MSSSSASVSTSSSNEATPSKVARLDGENSVATEEVTVMKVKTNDDKVFTVDFELLMQSHLISNIIGFGLKPHPDGEPLVLPHVNGTIFEKILVWCAHHKGEVEYDIDEKENKALPIPSWDEEWFNRFDTKTVLDICKAANYLEIKVLLDMSCKAVAAMMTGKRAQEIRDLFQIENDFTPEEEAEFDSNPIWCDEF